MVSRGAEISGFEALFMAPCRARCSDSAMAGLSPLASNDLPVYFDPMPLRPGPGITTAHPREWGRRGHEGRCAQSSKGGARRTGTNYRCGM